MEPAAAQPKPKKEFKQAKVMSNDEDVAIFYKELLECKLKADYEQLFATIGEKKKGKVEELKTELYKKALELLKEAKQARLIKIAGVLGVKPAGRTNQDYVDVIWSRFDLKRPAPEELKGPVVKKPRIDNNKAYVNAQKDRNEAEKAVEEAINKLRAAWDEEERLGGLIGAPKPTRPKLVWKW
jgi:hypothetical protein